MAENSQEENLSDSDLSSTLLGSTQDPTYQPSGDESTRGNNEKSEFINVTFYFAADDDGDSTGSFFFSQREGILDSDQEEVEANFDLGDSPIIEDEEGMIIQDDEKDMEEAKDKEGSKEKDNVVEDEHFNDSFCVWAEEINLMTTMAETPVDDDKKEAAGEGSDDLVEKQEEGTHSGAGLSKGRKKERKLRKENVHVDPDEHVRQKIPDTTKKSTNYAVNLFNSTMLLLSKELNFKYDDLKDTSIVNLPWRLAKFFMVVTKVDGDAMNASSLETIYASLARFLSTEFVPRIDIKADVNFKTVRENLDAAKQESTKEGHRPGKNKARPFQDEHIELCWRKKTLGRSNPRSPLYNLS